MSLSRPVLTAVFPQLLHEGGIQRLSRHHAIVMAALAREQGWACRFFSLADPAGPGRVSVDGRHADFTGLGGNRLKLTLRVMQAARTSRLLSLHHVNLAPMGWMARRLNSRLRYHVHVFGIDVWSPLPPLRQRALAGADLTISISNDTTARMNAAQARRPSKVALLYPTLDPEFMQALAVAPTPEQLPPGVRNPYFLVVGRLSVADQYKGVDTLIKALALLGPEHAALRMVVVGDGNDRPRLEALARELQVAHRVLFLGRQPDEMLRRLLALCDFFALPSGKEGFGIVFLEAMANKKAVIACASGGVQEIVLDGVTGILVPYKDTALLGLALGRLCSDLAFRARLGNAGFQRLQDHFSFKLFEQSYRRILIASVEGN